MAKIKVKGFHEPIIISRGDGVMLRSMIENKQTGFVTVGNFSGNIKDISFVVLEDEYEPIYGSAAKDDYDKARKEFLALPDKERAAKQKNYFRMIFKGMNGKYPDEEEIKDALNKAYIYIKNNPFRMWVDPTIWMEKDAKMAEMTLNVVENVERREVGEVSDAEGQVDSLVETG